LLFTIVNVINTKIIKAFKFTLTKFLLEFLLRYVANARLYKDFLRTKIVKNKIKTILTKNIFNIKALIIEERHFKKQFVKINAIRDLTLNKRIKISKNLTKKNKDKSLLKIEDLLQLRCYYFNNTYTSKLLERFEESY